MTLSATLAASTQVTNPAAHALPANLLEHVIEVDTPVGMTIGQRETILVTRASLRREPVEIPEGMVGTIREVDPAWATHHGWVPSPLIPGTDRNTRLHGAPLNPEPALGNYYMFLGPTDYRRGTIVVRENTSPGINYRIVQHADGSRPAFTDGWDAIDAFLYVEVRNPHAVTEAVDEIEELLAPDEPVGIPTEPGSIPPTSLTTHARNFVQLNDDGRVPLNPTPIDGEGYVLWQEGHPAGEVMHVTSINGQWIPVGMFFTWGYSEDAYLSLDRLDQPYAWAKIKEDEVTAPANNPTEAEALAATTSELEAKFEGMLEELNVVADEQGWCPEFEENMGRIGLPGRRGGPNGGRHAYDITVSVDFSGEIDYVPGGLVSQIESAADFDGSVNSVRFDASTSVTVYGVVAESEEDARDNLDSSDVENAMDGAGISYTDISDWEITDSEEDDNFDWSEYEG